MNSNIENDYDQCFIGNHLKEECHKKSFSQKTGMILLQDVSEKDRALPEWKCEVKISESDLSSWQNVFETICRFAKILLWSLQYTWWPLCNK